VCTAEDFKDNGVSWCRDNEWDATIINDDVGNLGKAVLNPTSGDLKNLSGTVPGTHSQGAIQWMCVGATRWRSIIKMAAPVDATTVAITPGTSFSAS